jgi:hypothetical protein
MSEEGGVSERRPFHVCRMSVITITPGSCVAGIMRCVRYKCCGAAVKFLSCLKTVWGSTISVEAFEKPPAAQKIDRCELSRYEPNPWQALAEAERKAAS